MKDEKLAVSSYLSSVRVSKATLEEWERDCEAIFGTRDLLGADAPTTIRKDKH